MTGNDMAGGLGKAFQCLDWIVLLERLGRSLMMDTRHCIFIISFIRYIHQHGPAEDGSACLWGLRVVDHIRPSTIEVLTSLLELASTGLVRCIITLVSDNGVDLYGIWDVTSLGLGLYWDRLVRGGHSMYSISEAIY